jgi:hypothetical protein
MMGTLQRPDVADVGDLDVKKGCEIWFGKETGYFRATGKLQEAREAEMRALFAPWAPYRSLGSTLMLAVGRGCLVGKV